MLLKYLFFTFTFYFLRKFQLKVNDTLTDRIGLQTYNFKIMEFFFLSIDNIKNFRNDYFRIELENALLKYDITSIDYDNFIKTFLTVLEKHAPIKKQYLRANYVNFVTKQLRKAIMKRSKLCDDFLKDRNDASVSAYRKQRNLCVTLLRKAKKQYFSNLEPKLLTDTKHFGNQLNHSSLIK